jgi:predicted dehydrogenase
MKGAAVAGGLIIVPRHVLGGDGHMPPSEVLTRASIGVGAQGFRRMLENKEGQPPALLAVCDLDKNHLKRAMEKAGPKCAGYHDFRRVLERKDIDSVHIATPDHWHALITVAAAQAGKDILCEKPMTHTVREGDAIIEAVKRNKRVLHVNTQGRHLWVRHRKLVTSGLLGWPLTVYLGPSTGFDWKLKQWAGRTDLDAQPVPAELDYDFWLGPAPKKPYHPHRVHGTFRGYWHYAGGGLMDMGQHYIDPVQYFLGKDDTGPVEVEAIAPPQHEDAAGPWGRITMKYDDGCTVILDSGEWDGCPEEPRPMIEGPKGKVFGGRRGNQTEPAGLWQQLEKLPDPPKLIPFDEAVKLRRFDGGDKPNAEQGHRSATLLHLATIAVRTGRRIKWDAVAQQIVGDVRAVEMLQSPMRRPWRL